MEKLLFDELVADKKAIGYVLLSGIEQKVTRNGSDYCVLLMSDGTRVIEANLWNTSKGDLRVEERSVIAVEIYPSIYNDRMAYEVKKYYPADDCGFSPLDFIIKAPYEAEKMYEEIIQLVETCNTENRSDTLSELVKYIYDINREKLLYWSAAKSIHHNMYAGLLYHTFRMIRLAVVILKVYPCLDAELLLSATALHDIGKLQELSTDVLGNADYTIDGTLFGHLYLGMKEVEQAASVIQCEDERVKCLLHCIAAHHGQKDWGAVAEPVLKEAMVLHFIDMIDSRIEQYEQVLKGLIPGQLSNPIFGLGNNRVYYPI